MMKREKSASKYKVGYKRPPLQTRFRKGQSGNPAGRPRGSRNLATLIREALNALVEVRVHGQLRRISKLHASAINFANRVAAGDPRALEFLLKNPTLLREVAELKRRGGLTLADFERARLLLRGDDQPQDDQVQPPANGTGRQPDLSDALRALKRVGKGDPED